MLWAPQVFTCGVSACAFPPHTLECVRVCNMYESSVYMKFIVNWYWQLLSGRWSHFCGGPHICVCVCVCFYMFISSGPALVVPFRGRVKFWANVCRLQCVSPKLFPRDGGWSGCLSKTAFFSLILGELPLPPVLKFMQRQYSLIAVSHYQHILSKAITICWCKTLAFLTDRQRDRMNEGMKET